MIQDEIKKSDDIVLQRLRKCTQAILVAITGVLPLFFIPLSSVPFEYAKILFVLVGIIGVIILFSLSVLRSGTLTLKFPYAGYGLWLIFFVTLASSMISGDFTDSFIGDFFSVHSTAFIGLLALTASIWVLVDADKVAIMRTYILITASTIVLAVFHILRLFLGTDFLSAGIFTSTVSTPVGGWNDLALFFGLSIILSLMALEQLSLSRWGKYLFSAVSVVALIMLAIINFFYVWFVLGLVGLVMLVYALRKPNLVGGQQMLIAEKKSESSSVALSALVLLVSILFIVTGSAIGNFMSEVTDISYIEVRPSFGSTIDIAGSVYQESAFLGVGPNKFDDAWRTYKDQTINTTVFWDTEFSAGSGYIPTFFVTAGVFGGVAWLVFITLFLVMGVRMLVTASLTDKMWYFIGSSSFVSGLYIWGMSFIYVPGATVLMVGAFCTGIMFLAHNALRPLSKSIDVSANRRTGFILTLGVVAVIVLSVSVLYVVGRHFTAAYLFLGATDATSEDLRIETAEASLMKAYNLTGSDLFVRRIAEYEFGQINALVQVDSPTEAQRIQFNQSLTNGINNANLATNAGRSESVNWLVLGNIYSLLVSANIEGSYVRAQEALGFAQNLDPKNPARYLDLATLEARNGNLVEAKRLGELAVGLKPNYSEGFFFLTQVAIAAGNVSEATERARAVIALEPQNPARHYQLGILESAQGNIDKAVSALEEAVRLDSEYANARYFLALGYDALGRANDAKIQLEKVLELNPGNADVLTLLESIKNTGSAGIDSTTLSQPVVGEDVGIGADVNNVTAESSPETSLLKTVNTVPGVVEEENQSAPNEL